MLSYRTLDIVGLWNKFESQKFDQDTIIPRFQTNSLIKRFEKRNIEVILGPRQSGKTTLLFMLMNELLQRDIVPGQIFYINLDTIIEMEQFKNPMLLARQVEEQAQVNQRIYLFIDEVQRLESPGKFLKGIYDLNKNIKIIVSGSSSIEIKAKIKESLTGRKRETFLLPISFKEYIHYEKKLPDDLSDFRLDVDSVPDWEQNEDLYGRYLLNKMNALAVYGAYPSVLNAKSENDRIEDLSEIYNSYVKRDIIDFMGLEKTTLFNRLVKTLAAQTGNLMNKSEICSIVGSNAVTITKYLNVLEETFVTVYLPPLISNKRNEIKRAHKCYFIDNGFRNLSIKQFNPLRDRTDKGALLENLILSEFLKHITLKEEIYFWRTKAGSEVDFVVRHDQGLIPIEIKSGPARAGRLPKSFHAFLAHFAPEKAILLNKDLFHVARLGKTEVSYVPLHWFLFLGLEMIPH